MIYQGKAITVKPLEGGIVELNFDLKGESVNKFNRLTLSELRAAVDAIKADASVKGVIVTSGKDVFIVGADITEFVDNFQLPDEELMAGNLEANKIFSDFEDLDVPTVAAINGIALGGGLEMCLAADFRVMSATAKVGLPEVKLGIYPGFGGTVRLPRLIGCDNAVEWIASGKENKAEDALKVGAVDAVVAPEQLQAAALDLAKRAVAGELDHKARRQPKLEKLKLNAIEQMMAFETAKGFVAGQAGPNYPAPVEAIKSIQKAANFGRDKALEVEAAGFVKLAKTSVAQSLIGLFLNDQELKKKAKKYDEVAKDVKLAAVLGAGIMGGGIAYQSALKGTPILMKDIREEGIQMGLNEAAKLLGKRVEKGRLTPAKMAEALNGIRPTMSYGDFGNVDIVVEAVVENPKVKQAVLAEVEGAVKEDAIIASNTSTISISLLAQALKRPENFCGMHFFNPVHMMPLVEVIRGEKTGETAIATTVAYAKKMGKSPIVVNDCPGFLVNRVLFPYFGGFAKLLSFGVDFVRIDKVMGEVRLAHGPGLPVRRGRHRHRPPWPRRHGRGLPGPHGGRGQDRRRRDVRGQPPGPEERQGLLRLRDRQARQAEEGHRSAGLRSAQADRGRAARSDRRGHRQLHDDPAVPGNRALPGGRHRRDRCRGRYGPDLRHRLPALPWWCSALHRFDRCRRVRGPGRQVRRAGRAVPPDREAA
ncbi:multifunctional fatty acid oxidation complex subunit alpha [Pseudomonas aeruginosa]|nr:multifunctional fatty acid oxidation complex subunit alpha [Pseudomonas aeruginosa]